MEIWTPIYYMVPWVYPSPQPERHLDRFSCFAGLTSVTVRDRPTDHATRSVTIGRIYVHNRGYDSLTYKVLTTTQPRL